jgi:hypothetical protein
MTVIRSKSVGGVASPSRTFSTATFDIRNVSFGVSFQRYIGNLKSTDKLATSADSIALTATLHALGQELGEIPQETQGV